MRLDHIDLHVPNVAETRDFFVRYFGLRLAETRGVDGLAILYDEAGLELIISHPIQKLGGSDNVATGKNTYHVGFTLTNRAEVDQLHRTLSAFMSVSPPREMRGMWLFYCYAPGQILVEVRAR